MHPTEPKLVRAYGDREGDGMVQMSFVLPLPPSAKSKEAARKFAELHGLLEPLVTTMEEVAEGHCYFVVYGHSRHAVDVTKLEVPELKNVLLTRDEIESRVEKRLGRKIVVVGACTGSDAHTVGIDAVLNYKATPATKGSRATAASKRTTSGRKWRTSSSRHGRALSARTPSW